MSEVLDHPLRKFMTEDEVFTFSDGAKLTLTPAPDSILTVKDAIYMLEDCKIQILTMMRE